MSFISVSSPGGRPMCLIGSLIHSVPVRLSLSHGGRREPPTLPEPPIDFPPAIDYLS